VFGRSSPKTEEKTRGGAGNGLNHWVQRPKRKLLELTVPSLPHKAGKLTFKHFIFF
jgi:hypothetical protein